MPADIVVEDTMPDERQVLLLCRLSPTDSVVVTCWFDYEQKCGLSAISDNNGDDLCLDPLVHDLLLVALDRRLGLTKFLRSYLSESDSRDGDIYRSRRPIDWDAIAKERRSDTD